MGNASASARMLDLRDAWTARREQARYGLYRFRQSPLAVLGGSIVLLYLLVALFAPLIVEPPAGHRAPAWDSVVVVIPPSFAEDTLPPSKEHPMGTGTYGVDLLYGVVWGSRVSMAMGVGITLAGVAIGTILGVLAGYVGGWLDDFIMRVTDVFLALPLLILAMAVAIALGRSLENVAIALVLVWWPSYTRLVRGQVLSVRENQYVEAARASGLSEGRIMLRHVLPNSLSPIIVQMTLDIGSVVLVASALAFIGFASVESNTAEWGSLVAEGQNYVVTGQWWTVVFPGLAIFGFVLGFNLLGDGLRDLLDPRLRK